MSEVVTVPVTLNVPKETKEVVDLLAAIADNVIAKKPVAEWVNIIDETMAALQGVDQVPAEVKSEHKGAIVAYLAQTVGSKL